MKIIMTTAAALLALSALPPPAHSHDDKHSHATYSAGEPGDPKKPSRTIQVEMSEMAYTPPMR